LKRIAAIVGVLALLAIGALAQTDDVADDNNFIVRLLENRMSGPGRQIRVHGIRGALSSRARIGEITVSDDQGVWLRVRDVEIDWTRLELLLGRVNVNRLTVGGIDWLRRAVRPSGPPRPEAAAEPFALPQLPVAIRLQELDFGRVAFAEPVFGLAAELGATGSLNLVRGALDTDLDIRRLDGPGGELTLDASFSSQTRQLAVDLHLQEPAGGVVANLLRIENRPAIDLRLSGEGPLDQVDLTFALDADGDRIAGGVAELRGRDDGLGFDVDLSGGLAPLIPPRFRDFFEGQSALRVAGVSKTGGGIRIDDLALEGAVLRLDGRAETGADGFLRALNLQGTLGDPRGPAVVLPVPGGDTRLHSAVLHVNYGDASRWNGLLVLDRLEAGGIEMEDVTLTMGGLAQNLDDPARRNVTVSLEGLATGVWSDDPEVAAALGNRIDLFADVALPPGAPAAVRQLQVSGNGLSIFSAGTVSDFVYTGRNAVRIDDLAILSGLAGRDLGGAVSVRATGSVSPFAGGFDLTFDGGATELRVGNPPIDPLLAGASTISGRGVRDANGIRAENLRIENPQVTFSSNGQYSTARTDITFDARLADLALVDPRIAGELTVTGAAAGQGQPITVTLAVEVEEGELMGRRLTGARLGFEGQVDGAAVRGRLGGGGQLDELVLDVAGDIAVEGDDRTLSGLRVAVGPNTLTGDLVQRDGAPIEGRLVLRAPEIAPLAAFALTEASGAIDADIALAAGEVGQEVTVSARARDVVQGATRIEALELDAGVSDALGVPMVQGDVSASGLTLAGVEVASLSATAEQIDRDRMRFDADARLVIGTLAALSGELARQPEGFAATLDALRLRHDRVSAQLTAPATVTVAGGTVELTPTALQVGSGSVTAQGRIADAFDVSLAIRDLPLDIANAVRPDLGLAGRVNGTARVSGPRANPDVRFDLRAAEVASAATRAAGVPAIALDARGATTGSRLTLDANVGGGGGLAATARGSLPLGPGTLDLDVSLQSFPLVLIDRLAGGQGLQGTVTGQSRLTGTLANPSATFELRGSGVSTRLLRDNGLPPLGFTASGGFQGRTITLRSAIVTGPQGLDLSGSGRIPLAGPGLDLRVAGAVPLSLADPLLDERSAQASGLLRINATARGSLAAPQLAGTVSLAGGTLNDPNTNIRLENISLDAALEGRSVRLGSFRANAAAGGSITAQGSIVLDGARGYPASLAMRINDVRYTDGVFVHTRLSGQLALEGPITGGGGLLSGRIDLGPTEISIAEGLGFNAAATLEQVAHVHTPRAVQITLDRARVGEPRPPTPTVSRGMRLDVRINAPSRIFVRGRGLDVELGGQLTLRGTADDIQPVGQFDLRRGRILILGQRIDFQEGRLQLIGNLDPEIFFVARTRTADVTAVVTVDGRVSNPQITFSSEPPLPQDEVLARVLFKRATQDLSAFQLAQLAAAAAELAGGGGNGLLTRLRGAVGLDDLDIVTEEDGGTAVRAGKYIDENIYLNLETGAGETSAEIVLELSDRITARGQVESDGNTTLGIFFQRDF
jgi:translocation and assembly module TamB